MPVSQNLQISPKWFWCAAGLGTSVGNLTSNELITWLSYLKYLRMAEEQKYETVWWIKTSILNWRQFCPPGPFVNSWKSFCLSQWEGVCYRHLVSRSQSAAKSLNAQGSSRVKDYRPKCVVKTRVALIRTSASQTFKCIRIICDSY